MDTGHEVIGRAVEDVLTGRLHWVPRPLVEREINPAPLAANRREHDRLRKRRQRAKATGRPA
jgi:hypothetical protein